MGLFSFFTKRDNSLPNNQDSDDELLLPNNQENDDDDEQQQHEQQQIEDFSQKDYTTNSELFGWYLYSWAAEPFVVSAMSTYVPILLEQFARENGVRLDDHSMPCIQPSDPGITPSPLLPPPTTNTTMAIDATRSLAKLFARDIQAEQETVKCVLYVLGSYIDTSSYALYTFSFSVLVQTLTVISMSGAADRGHYRKHLLITFGVIGALATISFKLITSAKYYLASILAIVAISSFGAVNVCGNAFLPILISNSKEIKNENDSLRKSNLITKISGVGAASGYISALIVQILSMLIVLKTGSSTSSIQYAIFFVGVWWLVFQIPLTYLLKSRPGPPLSINKNEHYFVQYIKYGWKALFASIKHASNLRDVLIYLFGWFIISDSVTTMNSAAILFAKTELQMTTPKLVIIGILSVISAILGSIIIPQLQSYYKVSPKTSLIAIIVWASIIPFYGILGFFFKQIGLKHVFEMYILAIWYGVSMGGLATVSRSLFSLLIPKGKESTFFSLFSVTDKGSSVIGPTVTALITDKTHNIRYCFFFLWFLLIIAIPVYSLLDVERGNKEARELEHVEDLE
ncbi:hypothetical protein WICMUC_003048 [Wickerhamomyces mucosus]|uniref:Autophagy-related protein n=1 Tax=Wickerhamomyces mucosus TaxID=1378264 RepID=A0A9P8PNN4_9ASCO|nr:hypothetical protein WICMUC_003048 [Wickerhamomyces mucosus]